MPKISNNDRTGSRRVFIEDMTRLLMSRGVPQAAARLYGYLLLCAAPASLDSSKSSASVAARLLERYTLVRRHGERGSKRALYAVSENYEGILSEEKRLLQAMADLLEAGARTAPTGAAQQRLEVMTKFYQVILEGMDTALQKWRARKSK